MSRAAPAHAAPGSEKACGPHKREFRVETRVDGFCKLDQCLLLPLDFPLVT